jgi:hypothetical protein
MQGDWSQAGQTLVQHLVTVIPEFELADIHWYAQQINVSVEHLQMHLRSEELCVNFISRINRSLEQRGWQRFVVWEYLGQEYYQSVEVLDEEFVVVRKQTDV